MQDRPVPDGAALPDHERIAGIGVEHAEILNVAARADPDLLIVAAQDSAEPDARLLLEHHTPDQLGAFGNPAEAVRQAGCDPLQCEKCHGRPPSIYGLTVKAPEDGASVQRFLRPVSRSKPCRAA